MKKAFPLLLLLMLIGCDKSFNSLTVDVTHIGAIHIFDSVEIKWTVNGREVQEDTRFRWVSRNPEIASVNKGIVTGRYPGTATLDLYLFGDDKKSSADDMLLESMKVIVMDYNVESVLVAPDSVELYPEKHYSLTAAVLPYTTTQQGVSWSSSDNSVAVVSQTGVVTGKKPGTAKIRATSTSNPGAFSECALTVKKIDTLRIVTDNKAGSHPIIGGDNPDIPAYGTDFLSYSNGMVYWPENTTGKLRHQELVIPATGSRIEVTQVGPEAFKGSWIMKSRMYSGVSSIGVTEIMDISIEGPPADKGNLGIKGLYYDAILPAQFTIESELGSVRFGVLLDERAAHEAHNEKTDYPYVCFVPMCASGIDSFGYDNGPYDMAPVPINDSDNYMWLWFDVSDDFKILRYYTANWQFVPGTGGAGGKPVAGISCLPSKSASPSAGDLNDTYEVSYYASKITSGLVFERK